MKKFFLKFKENETFIETILWTIQYGLIVGGLKALKYKDLNVFKTWMIFTIFLLVGSISSYWIVSCIMKKPFKNIPLPHLILFVVPLSIIIIITMGLIFGESGFNIYPVYP